MGKDSDNIIEGQSTSQYDSKEISMHGYSQFKLPDKNSEKWRKINMNRVEKILELTKDGEMKKSNLKIPKLPDSSLRIRLDENLNELRSKALPNGISVIDDKEAKRYFEEEGNKNCLSDDWSLALNNQYLNKIIAIKISKQSKSSIEVVIPDNSGCLTTTRLLIIVDTHAELELLEVILGTKETAHSHLCKIVLNKNAKINHGLIAIGNSQSYFIGKISVSQFPSSEYSLSFLQEGWQLSRLEPEIKQNHGDSLTSIKGLQIARKDGQLSTFSKIIFNGPQGKLNQIQKSISLDNSHSIFNGLIEVPKVAQKTNASQLSKNLLLSDKAKIDTKPELRIIADDVRCTHGATISELQEEEIFYLQSRGLSSSQAASLIISGFSRDVIQALPLEPKRWSFLSSFIN